MYGELLNELGRSEEALTWTVNFPLPWSYQCVYMAPVYNRRAEYYEQTGETDRAVEYYQKFIDRWKDCDEELRPMVDEARKKIENLQTSAG